jgi:hypothetical protein
LILAMEVFVTSRELWLRISFLVAKNLMAKNLVAKNLVAKNLVAKNLVAKNLVAKCYFLTIRY